MKKALMTLAVVTVMFSLGALNGCNRQNMNEPMKSSMETMQEEKMDTGKESMQENKMQDFMRWNGMPQDLQVAYTCISCKQITVLEWLKSLFC